MERNPSKPGRKLNSADGLSRPKGRFKSPLGGGRQTMMEGWRAPRCAPGGITPLASPVQHARGGILPILSATSGNFCIPHGEERGAPRVLNHENTNLILRDALHSRAPQ